MEQPSAPAPALVQTEKPKDGSTFKALVAAAVAVIVVMALLVIAFVSARVATESMTSELKLLRKSNQDFVTAFEKAKDYNIDQMTELIEAVSEIGPMVPPTNDKLFSILGRGIGVSENVVRTGQVGTTPAAAFATDLTTVQQSDAYTQEVIFRNRDDATAPTNNLCFFPLTWASAGANCQAKCAASTGTCPAVGGAGASTDGSLVPASSASHRRYDGTSCLCIVASAASTEYQTERVLR